MYEHNPYKVLGRLEREGPLSAMEYFSVDKSTLVSLSSNVLTYIIILIQMPSTDK